MAQVALVLGQPIDAIALAARRGVDRRPEPRARGLVALSDETNGLENLPEYYLPDDIIITTALFAWSRTGVAAGACHDLHTVIRFIHLDCNIT